jgi:hypothetical protein
LTQEAAESELREILEDEPSWKEVLRVVPIVPDGRNLSASVTTEPVVLTATSDAARSGKKS